MNETDSNVLIFDANGSGSFTLAPYEKTMESERGFVPLSLNQEQTRQVSALVQHIPAVAATATLAETYVARFPDGLQHTLMALKQGGVSSTYKDELGKFAGTASLYKTSMQAVLLGAFTAMSAMSAVSGQYFLASINESLSVMKMSIDKILEFLYGDKKAELMSEMNFVRYAYENFDSIVTHESQCIATIASLQEARKVAMKDIEFYMSDLDSIVRGKDSLDILVNKSLQIKESLDLSLQLYVMSSLLEVYFSQNYERSYLDYLERDVTVYIDKCEKRILSCFSMLSRVVADYKGRPLEKIDKKIYEQRIEDIILSLGSGKESDLRRAYCQTLRAVSNAVEYHLTRDGMVYLKAS